MVETADREDLSMIELNIEAVLRLTMFPRAMLHRKRVLSLYRVGPRLTHQSGLWSTIAA